MTKQKLSNAVRLGLRESAGADTETVVAEVVRCIELAFALEDSNDLGDFPTVDVPSSAKPDSHDTLPSSPAVQPVGAGQVPATESQSERQTPSPPTSEQPGIGPYIQPPDPDGWKIETFVDAITRHTPKQISFDVEVPGRGKVNVALDRNVEADPTLELGCKLSYCHRAITDGSLVACKMLWMAEQRIDIGAVMAEIRDQALKLYQPKPSRVVSTVPIVSGALRLDQNAPHEDAD